MDKLRFRIEKFKNRGVNKEFKQDNPKVKLPPDYLIYESFRMHYAKYYEGGKANAVQLANEFAKHLTLKNKRILDWGCGPGRIVRHLPEVIGNGCEYYGTDYNEQSINWCSNNLKGINFNKNTLEAHLPYEDNFMDVIYGISIFTHLSEQLHYDWYLELYRILKPGGIMYLTTQGENFKVKMTDAEIAQYNKNQLVVRGQVKEGHRTYSAFHPEKFMHQIFSNAHIVAHLKTPPKNNNYLPQDVWIIKKS